MRCKFCKRDLPDNSLYCNWCGRYQLKRPKDEIKVPEPRKHGKVWRIELRREKLYATATTPEACRKKAIEMRKKWLADEAAGLHEEPVKVLALGEVVDAYIKAKTPVLSPSTISGYQSKRDNCFKYHWDDPVTELDPQAIVNDEVLLGRSPKTIANAWGLCSTALKYAKIPFTPPSLPRRAKAERQWLDYKQIQTFLSLIHGQPCELGALLALHSLRRSEIFGLRWIDYDKKQKLIRVRGAMLSTIQSGWVRTDLNKTASSSRDIPIIIPRLSELLDATNHTTEFIIGDTQKNLYREINAICSQVGLPTPGLHGLRHSFASLAYHLDWKKKTTMQIGGWRNSRVLDEIYTHNADLESDVKLMQSFFGADTGEK